MSSVDDMESNIKPPFILSVVVPITRMSGRFNELKSWILASTELPLQIILIHDIQDSLTGVELREFINTRPGRNIKIIEGTYGSPGITRNQGLKLILSPWVAFWDADDLPRPETVLSAIRETDNDTEVIIGNFITNSGKSMIENHHQCRLENVAINPALWRMVIRSSIIQGLNFNSCLMGEDQIFLIDLNLGARRIYFSNEIFYEYFQSHPMQLTMNQKSVNEVSIATRLAKKKLQQNSKLRNIFSEIVLLRLFGTTLVRTRGLIRLKNLLKNINILVIPNRSSFVRLYTAIMSGKRIN